MEGYLEIMENQVYIIVYSYLQFCNVSFVPDKQMGVGRAF